MLLDLEKSDQLKLLELLQFRELKIYEKYLLLLEEKVSASIENQIDENSLNNMMASRKDMMAHIDHVEIELGPLRKIISTWSQQLIAPMHSTIAVRIESIKRIDLQIIDTINKISRQEQKITVEIKNQLQRIQSDLKNIEAKKKLDTGYQSKTSQRTIGFDSSG